MKAVIKKVLKPDGDEFFYVFSKDETDKEKYITCSFFSSEENDENSPKHEKYAFKKAMGIAKYIEDGNGKDLEIIVYETATKITDK